MNKVVDLFLKLVQIDSPSGKEKNMILFITNWVKKQSLFCQVDKIGNVLVKNNGRGQPFLFCVHLDTVQPGEKIKPIIKNDVIKSIDDTILGADNKVALASLLSAIEEYLKSNNNQKSFELLFTVKEEIGGGIEYFPFKWLKSKKGFVFDCAKPLGSIILSSPYIINFNAEFIGQPAHASTPEKGHNALFPVIKSLNKLFIEKTDKNTKINIGYISGGSGINVIPNQIVLSGELRSYNKAQFKNKLKKIENIFYNQSKKYKTKLLFKTNGFCPGYKHNTSSEFIKNINNVFKNLDIKTKFGYSFGVSDANILNNHGIETINLGDGIINPHTTDEQVEIKTLIQLKEIIKQFFNCL
jgi:tripeptide aminopeptidase